MFRNVLWLLIWAALLALASCVSHTEGPGQSRHFSPAPSAIGGTFPQVGLLPLPAPRSLQPLAPLLAPRAGSYLNDNLVLGGQDFDPALPNNRVTAQISDALYGPDWTQNSDGFGNLAYAIYNFDLPGYDGSPELSWEWDGAAPAGV